MRSLRTKRKEAAGNEEARPRQECNLISNSDTTAAAGATAPAPTSCNSDIRRSVSLTYRGADKSLTRSTSLCILFDGVNISFDASLVLYI